MSDADPNLVLHLALDETQDGTTADSSANRNDGKVVGHIQLVPDETFGSCFRLDGADDYVELTNAGPALKGQSFTVEAWVNAREFGAGEAAVIGTEETAAGQGLRLSVKDGKPFMSFTGDETAGVTQLLAGVWFHLAWRFDKATGEQALFVNGLSDAATTGHAPFQGAGVLRAGRVTTAAAAKFFDGMMAHVRVYTRALAAEEIRQDMEADQTAASAYRKTHPLGFNLYDDNDQQALYISDNPTGYVLNLEIHNTSQQAVTLLRPDAATPSAENYHFELRFRPGTLYDAALQLLALDSVHLNETKLDANSWAVAYARQADMSDSVYFLNTAAEGSAGAVTLDPEARLVLRLRNITADGRGGARGTRVELRYRRLGYPGTTATLDGYGVQNISVVNQEGKKNVPLHVDFIGSGLVLNDGHTPNTVRLRIANLLKDDSLSWKPGKDEDDSRFTITFDAQGAKEEKEWALGETDQVGGIEIEASGGWEARKNLEADPTEWRVTHQTKTSLGPGEDIHLTISKIVTALPSGATALYLHYSNVPGYWDGLFTRPLVKTPIIYSGSNVGIGTNAPREALDTYKGLTAGAASDYTRAQFALTGGGVVTWGGTGGRLKWSQRFIAISMERGSTFSAGHVQIDMPTTDIQKEYVHDGAQRSATADGVLLKAWESLYAVHAVGGDQKAVTFRITNWTTTGKPQDEPPFYAPSNWILIASVNNDPGEQSVKLGTGAFVAAGSASAVGNALPRGMIMMWWGDAGKIPPGWALCDGAGGVTPDLRDRFIVGAGHDYGLNATGGVSTVKLTVGQMPKHRHAVTIYNDGNHSHVIPFDTGSGGSQYGDMAKVGDGLQKGVNANFTASTNAGGQHTHDSTCQDVGNDEPFDNRPPYWALYYIMKL